MRFLCSEYIHGTCQSLPYTPKRTYVATYPISSSSILTYSEVFVFRVVISGFRSYSLPKFLEIIYTSHVSYLWISHSILRVSIDIPFFTICRGHASYLEIVWIPHSIPRDKIQGPFLLPTYRTDITFLS